MPSARPVLSCTSTAFVSTEHIAASSNSVFSRLDFKTAAMKLAAFLIETEKEGSVMRRW